MKRYIDIIVAHYKEDLGWIETINHPNIKSIHLYTKSDIVYDGSNKKVVQKFLPNIGREAHTYLYHIIDNYDNLANFNIFLQAQPGPQNIHHSLKWHNIKHSIKSLLINPYLTSCASCSYNFTTWHFQEGNLRHKNKVLHWNGESLLDTGKHFIDWFKTYIDSLVPYPFRVYWEANFGVSRANIQSRDIEYYEKLISQLPENATEAAHFLERSWYYVFKCGR